MLSAETKTGQAEYLLALPIIEDVDNVTMQLCFMMAKAVA